MSSNPYDEILKGYSPMSNSVDTPKSPYDDIIQGAAEAHGLDPDLIRATMRQESTFKPNARSPKGASGLMQLMPETAKNLGVKNILDPKENIYGGAKYLKQQLDKFGGDVPKALAAYNAGPGAVVKYGGIPPYKETRDYVKRITGNYKGLGYADPYGAILKDYAPQQDAPQQNEPQQGFLPPQDIPQQPAPAAPIMTPPQAVLPPETTQIEGMAPIEAPSAYPTGQVAPQSVAPQPVAQPVQNVASQGTQATAPPQKLNFATSEPTISDVNYDDKGNVIPDLTQQSNLRNAQISAKDAGSTIADQIDIPDNIKTLEGANKYVASQLKAKYGDVNIPKNFTISDWQPGRGATVDFNTLKSIGVDTDAILAQKVAENRVENPAQNVKPDMSPLPTFGEFVDEILGDRDQSGRLTDARRKQLEARTTLPDDTAAIDAVKQRLAMMPGVGGMMGTVGVNAVGGFLSKASTTLAGLNDYLGGAGILPAITQALYPEYDASNELGQFGNRIQKGSTESTPPNYKLVGEVGQMTGALPVYMAVGTLLGGNPVLTFGVTDLLSSKGAGASKGESLAAGGKGAIIGGAVGGLQRLGGLVADKMLGATADKITGDTLDDAGSKVARTLVERGTALGGAATIGYTTSAIEGGTPEENRKNALMWLGMEFVGMLLHKSPGEKLTAKDLDAANGTIVRVPGKDGTPHDVLYTKDGEQLKATDVTGQVPPEALSGAVLPKIPKPADKLSDDFASQPEKGFQITGGKSDNPAIVSPEENAAMLAKKAAENKPQTSDVMGFTTSKGSTYEVDGQSTTRTKSLHPEHEPTDVGKKSKSELTLYGDKEDVMPLGLGGMETPEGGKSVIRIEQNPDGTYSGTQIYYNPKTEKWTPLNGGKSFTLSTTPEVGKHPLELWDKETENGKTAYANSHAGNEIISVDKAPETSANSSSESTASQEAINRLESEKNAGLTRVVVDTRSKAERPLIGVDAVDYTPKPHESIEYRGGGRNGEVIAQGDKVSPAYSPPERDVATKTEAKPETKTAKPDVYEINADELAPENPAPTIVNDKEFYVSTPDGFRKVNGKSVDLDGHPNIDAFVHKVVDPKSEKSRWRVSEGSTGLTLGDGKTRQEAIDTATNHLRIVRPEATQEALKKGIEKTGLSPRYKSEPINTETPTETKPIDASKTNLDLILDRVTKENEVTIKLQDNISREQVKRVEDAAKDRGMTASFDGHNILIRRAIDVPKSEESKPIKEGSTVYNASGKEGEPPAEIKKGTVVYSKGDGKGNGVVRGVVESVNGKDLGVAWDNAKTEGDIGETTLDRVTTEAPKAEKAVESKVAEKPVETKVTEPKAEPSTGFTEGSKFTNVTTGKEGELYHDPKLGWRLKTGENSSTTFPNKFWSSQDHIAKTDEILASDKSPIEQAKEIVANEKPVSTQSNSTNKGTTQSRPNSENSTSNKSTETTPIKRPSEKLPTEVNAKGVTAESPVKEGGNDGGKSGESATGGEKPSAKASEVPEALKVFEKNKIFTPDAVAKARERLAKKGTQFNTGLDPETLHDLGVIGGAYIEAGARNFGEFASKMKADIKGISDDVLKQVYELVHKNYGDKIPNLEPPEGTKEVKQGERGSSKIGKSIEQKAIEQGLTEGFPETAGYDKKYRDDQIQRVEKVITQDYDMARRMALGLEPIPHEVSPVMLLRGMEEVAKARKDVQLQYELANSPLVSETSRHAQEMRFMQEREQDSATTALQAIRRERIAQTQRILKGRTVEEAIKQEAEKLASTMKRSVEHVKRQIKTKGAWDAFVDSIVC